MVLSEIGEFLIIEDKIYVVGTKVMGNSNDDYDGLTGIITEIRTDDDKETDNEGVDIYVCFDEPTDPDLIAKTCKRFSELYQMEKTLETIVFDLVILDPDSIDYIP